MSSPAGGQREQRVKGPLGVRMGPIPRGKRPEGVFPSVDRRDPFPRRIERLRTVTREESDRGHVRQRLHDVGETRCGVVGRSREFPRRHDPRQEEDRQGEEGNVADSRHYFSVVGTSTGALLPGGSESVTLMRNVSPAFGTVGIRRRGIASRTDGRERGVLRTGPAARDIPHDRAGVRIERVSFLLGELALRFGFPREKQFRRGGRRDFPVPPDLDPQRGRFRGGDDLLDPAPVPTRGRPSPGGRRAAPSRSRSVAPSAARPARGKTARQQEGEDQEERGDTGRDSSSRTLSAVAPVSSRTIPDGRETRTIGAAGSRGESVTGP